MGEIPPNTLYLLTPGTYVSRDHLTLVVETPIYPDDLAPAARVRRAACGSRKLPIPIHHLESICVFGASTISPPALELCWQNGVAVNYLNENGHLQARLTGIADTSVGLRRSQFRAADDPARCASIGRNIVVGKLQNSRNSLLRAARESENDSETSVLQSAADVLAGLIRQLAQPSMPSPTALDTLRGAEGHGAQVYFSAFTLMIKRQRDGFRFTTRTRRPPLDPINCLLSFLYALLRHDCVAALAAAGLDPFVGFLHAERPNRPALALDLMEEFRAWVADRLALTLVNRQQITVADFNRREGGITELTDAGRRTVIKAYQARKRDELSHTILQQNFAIGQFPFVQARILARHLRGDFSDYLPFLPK